MGRRVSPADAVQRILGEAGATVDDIRLKRHAKIKWTYLGQKRVTTVAQTPSDGRTLINSEALVRRQLREIERTTQ